jgi:hypothetical protein
VELALNYGMAVMEAHAPPLLDVQAAVAALLQLKPLLDLQAVAGVLLRLAVPVAAAGRMAQVKACLLLSQALLAV